MSIIVIFQVSSVLRVQDCGVLVLVIGQVNHLRLTACLLLIKQGEADEAEFD